jgi:hypothetical protein
MLSRPARLTLYAAAIAAAIASCALGEHPCETAMDPHMCYASAHPPGGYPDSALDTAAPR